MSYEAALVLYKKALTLDLRMIRLMEFFGVSYRTICVGAGETGDDLLVCQKSATCLMTSARSLTDMFSDDAMPLDGMKQLFERIPYILIYGVTPDEQEIETIRRVTDGLVVSVASFSRSDYDYQVSSTDPAIAGEFSGLTFGPIHSDIDHGLVMSQRQAGLSNLVSIQDLPIFAAIKKQKSHLFLLACRDIADLESQTDGPLSGSIYFSRLVLVLMFLKHALQDRLWHNPRRYANLIIDDPLLRKSYGFLNYARLLQVMDTSDFSTTIAFIPWNYRRTRASIAALIKARPERFSICVHGCDHTAGEFACPDVEQLSTQLHLATKRMRAHEQSTGVPYAKVMVFPQGKFAPASFGALKSHNYLAAVNSSPMPAHVKEAHTLTLAELLAPAVSKYNCFPLFVRRYPSHLVDFAFDLFLGKPALIVEHHDYFREGYKNVQKFTTQINSLSKQIKWANLEELISHTYLQRMVSPDTIECKLFANRQILHNGELVWKRYIISKYEDHEIPIKTVLVANRPHPYDIQDDRLSLCIDIPPKSTVEVDINYNHLYPDTKKTKSFKYHVKVSLRRHLSEIRDNYISRYKHALKPLSRITRRM